MLSIVKKNSISVWLQILQNTFKVFKLSKQLWLVKNIYSTLHFLLHNNVWLYRKWAKIDPKTTQPVLLRNAPVRKYSFSIQISALNKLLKNELHMIGQFKEWSIKIFYLCFRFSLTKRQWRSHLDMMASSKKSILTSNRYSC